MVEFDYTKTNAYKLGAKDPLKPYGKKDENVIVIDVVNVSPLEKALVFKDLISGFEFSCKVSYPLGIENFIGLNEELSRLYESIKAEREKGGYNG